ncbi:MAG TPA: NADP-dependent oxidoreductase [Candidatus Dormibacteraeota bacterium]|nr:NADP-dependent oxidoreductase [Candidatus Dormibacteraeota bacterium]
MRAFGIVDFGSAGVFDDLPEPELETTDVRVRVRAAGVNPLDADMASGRLHRRPKEEVRKRFPLALGMDLSGVVEAVGADVQGLAVGDEVFGLPGKPFFGCGAFAELAVASAATVARKPPEIDHVGAAAMPMAAMTALTAMDLVDPQPGETVLVVRAAGGVGSFAVQMAALRGATVLAVARSANADYLRDLGAAGLIDYERDDAVYPSDVDVLVDLLGDREQLPRLLAGVRPGGRAACVTVPPEDVLTDRRITAQTIMAMCTTERLGSVAGLVAGGRMRLPAIRTYTLDRAADALAEVRRGHVRGKLVVTVP